MKINHLLAWVMLVFTFQSYAQCDVGLTLVPDNNPVCFTTTTTLTAVGINAGTSPTYKFTDISFGGNSTLSNNSSNEITVGPVYFETTIEVLLTVNDGCAAGQEITDVITIEMTFGPNPIINEPETSICEGNSYELTATVGDASSYEWYKDGQPTGNFSKIFNVTEMADYTIIEDDGSCDPVESEAKTITVLENPTVDAGEDVTVAPGSSTTLNGASDYTSNIVWSPATALDDPNSLTPLCTPENTTIYTLTSYNQQCSASDQVQVFVSFLTSNDAFEEEALLLYPNPTNDMINIPYGNVDYFLYNAEGDLIDSGVGDQLDVSELQKGIYQLMFNNEGELITQKFTVSH